MASFIVAINAISGGGKTTVTREVQKRLEHSKALYFDDRDYDSDSGINDICEWVKDGADVNLWNLERFADDIKSLINEGLDFILLDYPFGYRQSQIAPYINCSIFIDTPLDIAMARRILRDYNDETATCIFDDMKHYLDKGRNTYIYGLDAVKESADILVDGSLSVDKIAHSICEQIRRKKDQWLTTQKNPTATATRASPR